MVAITFIINYKENASVKTKDKRGKCKMPSATKLNKLFTEVVNLKSLVTQFKRVNVFINSKLILALVIH